MIPQVLLGVSVSATMLVSCCGVGSKRLCCAGDAICEQLRRLGASCDWQRQQFTLDEGPAAAVREAFVQLHERGLIYRGEYLVNWSTLLQTAVSDLEVCALHVLRSNVHVCSCNIGSCTFLTGRI